MQLFILIVFLLTKVVESARILGVFSLPVYSHFILGETIFKELADKGHEVTVISSFPQNEKIKNYRDITITELNEVIENIRTDGRLVKNVKTSAFQAIATVYNFYTTCADVALQNRNVQKLLRSNETFDLIILEQFVNEAYFGFMHRFKAPVILISTASPSLWTGTLMGSPVPFSYVPNFYVDYSPNMDFWQRMYNTLVQTYQNLYFHFYILPRQNKILHKHFPDAPQIENLMYNASLLLLNYHPASAAAMPLQPNMINIGGFHIQKYRPLSEELQKFLDDAKEGVIYFSVGSFLRSKYLPKEKVREILNAFSKLKMKVLLKWEDDYLPGKPDNVRTEKWLSQAAVLAHENIKVLVTHGGRLSIIEAIYFGKPVLGIPLFAEQGYNVREAVHLGYGLYLPFVDLNEENFLEALKEIIKNPKYTKTARYRSKVLRDLPITPMDNAIHWIEYVLKYKDLPHLKNAGLNLTWYQLLLLDVVLFCSIVLWIMKIVLCTLFERFYRGENEKLKMN